MKSAFEKQQFDLIYPDGVEYHYWHRARNELVLRYIRQLSNNGPVLDIGSGRGSVLRHLIDNGIDAFGVEPGAVKNPLVSRERLWLSQSASDLPEHLRGRVVVISMLDVLEHLPEPVEMLRQLTRDFPICRCLLITVPARQELWSNFDEFNGHVRRYDRRELAAQIQAAGWFLQESRYAFRALYCPAWLLAKVLKKRQISLRVPGPAWRWAHRLVGHALVHEFSLLPGFVAGTSIIAVARRDQRK